MSKPKKRSRRHNDPVLPLLCAVLAVCAVVMILALCIPQTPTQGEFVPPAFDPSAQSGLPQVDASLGYSMLYQEGMAYRVSVCGVVTMDGTDAVVYFTNHAENEKYLKLRVLDANGKILGETGLLKPGEYVRCVTLSGHLAAGTTVKLKIMGYEPADYTSAGSVLIKTQIG